MSSPCQLDAINSHAIIAPMFTRSSPSFLIVDDFLPDVEMVRRIAEKEEYFEDAKGYKGVRSKPMRWPYVKEEFERLLNITITDWGQSMNGVFQKTDASNPLVYHADVQTHAGVIYLSKDIPLNAGLSLWRDKKYGCRRPPDNGKMCDEIFATPNLTSPDTWELVDRVSAIPGRLVLFSGKLIHSVTSYEGFTPDVPRLVQLYFFNSVEK